MLRFIDSVAHYNSSDLFLKWTSLGTPTATVAPGVNRNGTGNSIQVASGDNGFSQNFLFSAGNQQVWIIGFNFMTTDFGTGQNLVLIYDGSNVKGSLVTNYDGTVCFNPVGFGTRSTFAMAVNTWYYIEVQFYISSSVPANSCKINIEGNNVLTLPATSNMLWTGTNAYASIVEFTPITGTTNICDVYIADGSGSINNSILGTCQVEMRVPNGDDITGIWIPTNSPDYTCVNTVPVNLFKAISRGYYGSITTETFFYPSIVPTSGTVFGQQTVSYVQGNSSPTFLRSLVNSTSIQISTGTTPLSMLLAIFETDGGTAWTVSSVNSMVSGLQTVPTGLTGTWFAYQLPVETLISFSYIADINAIANLSSTSTLTAQAGITYSAKINLISTSSLIGNAHRITNAGANLSSTSLLIAKPVVIHNAQTILSSTSNLLGKPIVAHKAQASLITNTSMQITEGIVKMGQLSLTCNSTFTAQGKVNFGGLGVLSCTSSIVATSHITHNVKANLVVTSNFSLFGSFSRFAVVNLVGNSGLNPFANLKYKGQSSMLGSAILQGFSNPTAHASASLIVISSMVATPKVKYTGSLNCGIQSIMTCNSVLNPDPPVIHNAVANLIGDAEFVVTANTVVVTGLSYVDNLALNVTLGVINVPSSSSLTAIAS